MIINLEFMIIRDIMSELNYSDIKYPKMESLRKGLVSGLNPEEHYVCVEKLHGSNSQFFYQGSEDGPTWKLGKRNGWISPEEMVNFYNVGKAYQPFIQPLISACETACYELGMDSRHCQVSIFSEIYGPKVQKEMKYHDTETIAVFDIRVNDIFLCYDKVKNICQNHDLPMAPEVCKGTLGDLVSSFQVEDLYSLVPNVLHGNDIPDAPCEGVILRPVNQDGFENRFKWKKQAFCERQVKRVNTSEDGEVSNAVNYLNSQRFDCYMSKVGPQFILNRINLGSNIRALVQDTMTDIQEDFPELWLDTPRRKKANKIISGRASQMINQFIFDYVPPKLSPEDQLGQIEDNMKKTRSYILDIKTQLVDINARLIKFQ